MSGVIVALSVIILFLTNLFPFVSLSLTSTAGALLVVLILRLNFQYALRAFLATGILAGILLPNKEVVLLYLVFFGAYPLIKAKAEQLPHRFLILACKVIYCNLSMVLLYLATMFLFSMTFLADLFLDFSYGIGILWVLLNLTFFLYDRVLTLLVDFYFKRIMGK